MKDAAPIGSSARIFLYTAKFSDVKVHNTFLIEIR